jgi:fibronectin-binding autotransporter adhesin
VSRKSSGWLLARAFPTALLFALLHSAGWGITINDASTTRNSRFASGYPGSPVLNTDPNFIGAGYDWSGIGWVADYPIQSFALLGPRHFLMENHYQPSLGAHLNFVGTDGQLHSYTVGQLLGTHSGYPPDMAIGVLASPVPSGDNVHPYSILFTGYTPDNYIGSNILMYGKSAAIGWNSIADAGQLGTHWPYPYGPDTAQYANYLYDPLTPDRAIVESGDSGSPSFIVTSPSNPLYLNGGHYLLYANNAGAVDTDVPLSLGIISGWMAQTGYLPYVVTPITARWTGTGSGNWNTAGNWSPSSVPTDSFNGNGQVINCASVLFDGATTANRTITLGGNQTVTGIAFNSTAGSSAFTFSGTNTLKIGEAGLTNNDDDLQTINCPVALRASQRWTIGRGGLQVGSTISLGSSGYLLLVEGPGNVDLSGVISGTGSLAKAGSGMLTLSSTGNTYTGQTFINDGGVIAISQDKHLGLEPTSVVSNQLTINGGILRVMGTVPFDITSNRGITLDTPGGVIAVDGGQTVNGKSVIAGSGALVKSDSGTLILKANNTYTGTTTIIKGMLVLSATNGGIVQSAAYNVLQGTLKLDNATNPASPLGRLNDAAPLTLKDGAFQIIANDGGSTETLGSVFAAFGENTYNLVTGSGNSTVTNSSLVTSAGAIVNFTSSPAALGSNNKIVFSGASTGFINQKTFVGGANYAVYDAGGFLRAMTGGDGPNDYSTSITPNRHVQLTSSALGQDDTTLLTLKLSGGGVDFPLNTGKTLTLTNGGILKTGGGSSTISGGNGLTTSTEYAIRADASTDQLIINNPIAGGTGLTKSGQGILILGNSGNTFSGPTTVVAGTLKLGAAGAMPAASDLVVAGTATFDLGGYNATVAGITLSSGMIQNTGSAAALTLGGGTGGVSYIGAATGGTISVGALNLASAATLSGSHVFNIAAGQPPGVDLTVSSAIADGGTNAQTLIKDGTGTLKLTGSNNYTGGTTILAGTLMLGSNNALPNAASVTINGGTLSIEGYANTVGAVSLVSGAMTGTSGVLTGTSFDVRGGTISAIIGGFAALTKTTTGTVTLTAANTYSAGTYLNAGALSVGNNNQLGDPGGSLTFNGGTLRITGGTSNSFTAAPRAIIWNDGGGGFDIADAANVFTLTQNLAGPGQLTKAGQGTLLVAGTIGSANISIQDGTLKLGGPNRLSTTSVVSISGTGILDFAGNNQTVGSLVFSGGSINTGIGTLSLGGNVVYNRSIWTAKIDGNLDLGAATRTFDITKGSSSDLTISANISASGSGVGLCKIGTGILGLEGNNTYTGTTTINGGVLRAANWFLPSSNITINGGVWESNDDNIIRGLSSGASAVQITGGTSGFSAFSSSGFTINVDLGGNGFGTGPAVAWGTAAFNPSILVLNEYTAAAPLVFLNALKLNTDPTPVQRTIVANSIDYDTTISGVISDGDPGAGAASLVKIGLGALVLSASNIYTGSTSINAGTIQLANASALGNPNAVLTIGSGGTLDLNAITTGTKPVTINGYGANGSGALINSSPTAVSIGGPATQASSASIGGKGDITLTGSFNYGTSNLTKTGTNFVTLSGSQSWGSNSGVTVQSGTLIYNLNGDGTVSVAGGNTITVNSGAMLSLAGSKSALSDTLGSVNIVNNSSLGIDVIGTNQSAGVITGTGITTIEGGADFSARRIVQDALIFNGNSVNPARLTLLPQTGTGGGASNLGLGSGGGAVPEPTSWVMMASGALGLGAWHGWRRKYRGRQKG